MSKYNKNKSPKLLLPQDQVSDALKEVGKIMACCYELTGATGKCSSIILYNGKKFKIIFESI